MTAPDTLTPPAPSTDVEQPASAPVNGSTASPVAAPTAPVAPEATRTTSDERKTSEERKSALSLMVANASAQGYRVESQSDFQAVLIKGKPINHALHIIVSLLTLGLWLVGYAVIAAAGGEKRELVQVDEWGNVARQRL